MIKNTLYFIVPLVIFVYLFSGCTAFTDPGTKIGWRPRPPGMTVETVVAPSIDLISLFKHRAEDLCEGIIISKVTDAIPATGKAGLIETKLTEAIREIKSFEIKPALSNETNIIRPRIEAEVIQFKITDNISQGKSIRRGVAQVKFSMMTINNNVVESVIELYEKTKEKPVGGLLPSREKLAHRMALEVCRQFVKRIVFTKGRQYRAFKKGNTGVNQGITAASSGNLGGAQKIWQAELDNTPQNHAAAYNLGILFEIKDTQKDRERALELYQTALDLDFDDKDYARALNEITAKINNMRRLNFISDFTP